MERYSYLGLADNPFPPTGTPMRHWILSGQSRVKAFKQFSMAFDGAARGSILGVRISGGNGQGKSHIMRHAEYILNKKPGTKAAVYIHCPSDPRVIPDLCHLTELILDRLGKENFLEKLAYSLHGVELAKNLKSGSYEGLIKKRSRIPFRKVKYDPKYVDYLVKNISEDPLYIKEIESDVDFASVRRMVEETLEPFTNKDIYEPTFISPEVSQFILDYASLIENWGNLTAFYFKNTENALMTLKTLVNLMHLAGYNLFALLVDELERVEKSKQDIFLQTLCLLLEHGPPHTCVAVACTPRIWGKILGIGEEPASVIGPALKRRFTELVSLENVELADVKEIISAYLKEAERVLGTRKRYDMTPFTEESVELIWKGVGALLGDFLVTCYVAIELAAEQYEKLVDSSISKEALERVIAATGVPLRKPSLNPTPALSKRILDDFWGISRSSERSSRVEVALRKVLQKIVPLGHLTKVDLKKRRPKTSKGHREIDIVTYKGVKMIGLEVKTYELDKEVSKKALDASFLIVDEDIVHHLIVVSTSVLSIEAINEMKKRARKMSLIILDETKLSLLLYISDVMGIGRGATLEADEACNALKELGLLTVLENC